MAASSTASRTNSNETVQSGARLRRPHLVHLPGQVHRRHLPAAPSEGEGTPINKASHFRTAKFTDEQNIQAQVPWPIELVRHHTWEQYMGQPMVQKVPDTCALVACTVCVEAVHRLQHEIKLHGKAAATTTTTFPYRAAPPDELLKACHVDGAWNPGVGAYVRDVLEKIRELGGVLATTTTDKDAPTTPAAPPRVLLPLRSWEEHGWNDLAGAGTGLSPGRVADLLHNNGPCIGVLWVSPWYHLYAGDGDDALVYCSGCGRSDDDDDARRKIAELHPGETGWHTVVCFGYRFRFRGDDDDKAKKEMHVLVLDNHDATGPRRWIHVEELHALYTLSV